MRIAHVTATFPPYLGGTGNVCYHNARELARLGHEVHVFTAAMPGALPIEECDGFTIHRLRPLLRFGNAPLLPGLLRIKRFDLIHLHHPFIFGSELIWLVSRINRIPLVLTHHNDLIGDGLRKYIFDLYSFSSSRLIFSGVKKFAVVSLDHAKGCHLSNLFTQRWKDVYEVPNGVDEKMFRPGLDSSLIREQSGIQNNQKVLLFVGALDRAHHFKGADLLLRAFALQNFPDTDLVLIGSGDLKEGLIALANQLGLSERVHFLGSIQNNQLPPYYCMADVLVLPSLPPESFGMVLIEAMACGTPVIASSLPGVRTVVSNGQDGFLIEPGNVEELASKLGSLLSDPLMRRKMGTHGRAKVEAIYSWEHVTKKLEQVYKSALTH